MEKNNTYTYITYYYPPWGGVAAQWSIKLIKYLGRAGWRPNVITVKDSSIRYSDEKAAIDLPSDLKVVRAPNFDLAARLLKQRVKKSESEVAARPNKIKASILGLIRKFYEDFYLFEGQFIWIISSIILGLGSAKSSRVILATIRPGAAGVIGAILKILSNRPLIIDYRDPWTQNMTLPTGGPRKIIEEWLEKWVLRSADSVIAVSQPVLDGLKSKYPKLSFRGIVIPLGFDPDDFRGKVYLSKTKKINISYTGSLFTSRSPRVFLEGLRMAIDKKPEISSSIIVNFYGDFGGAAHEKMVRDLKLDKIVKIHGFISHGESVKKIMNSDWLLLIIESIPSENKKTYFKGVYTGKLFEYLAARKPILALSPESSAADLLIESKSGVVVSNSDPKKVADEIIKIVNKTYVNMVAERNEKIIGEFSMERNAEKLSKLFNLVT